MLVCILKRKFWLVELEIIFLPITCYHLVENICFLTPHQLVFSLQIIWSTLVLSAFLLPYSARSLITNLLVCSETSKHRRLLASLSCSSLFSLSRLPGCLFSSLPSFWNHSVQLPGPSASPVLFWGARLAFLDGREGDVKGKLSASAGLNRREGWGVGEERGAGVGEGC